MARYGRSPTLQLLTKRVASGAEPPRRASQTTPSARRVRAIVRRQNPMFRRIRIWTLIAALAILLAACGSATASAPVASTAAAPAAVATAAPAPTVVPASAAATAPAQDTAVQQSGSVRTFTIVPTQTEASYAVQEQFL